MDSLFSKNIKLIAQRLLLLIAIFCLNANMVVFAAFPITPKEVYPSQTTGTHEINQLPIFSKTTVGNPHSEDKGVFGILAMVFALLALFPLAIASGVVGTQNGRILKRWAKAGLILGLLELTVFIGFLIYRFVFS